MILMYSDGHKKEDEKRNCAVEKPDGMNDGTVSLI